MSGGMEGERPRGELTPGQTGQNQSPSEGGADYRAMFSSIRADHDRETFVADLRQHAEPLLSLARELGVQAKSATTREHGGNIAALGLFLEVAIKQSVLGIDDPYAGTLPRDEDVPADQDPQEWGEYFAFLATERVALNWIDDHPGSEAANEVLMFNKLGLHDPHKRLLQEMWPSIRDITSQSDKNK
jgi:hypothetical protein